MTRSVATRPFGGPWTDVYARAAALAPEAFSRDGELSHSWGGDWHAHGAPRQTVSPNDGTPLARPLRLSGAQAEGAVAAAAREHAAWAHTDLDERRSRVSAAVDALQEHRELLALLLAWEIGKPVTQARSSIDRTVGGVRWYLEGSEGMLAGRRPLGLVSNIASWNYPLSVLVHAMLVQALAGNAVIAKTPSAGGAAAVTLAVALARRAGVPLSLVHGAGSALGRALVQSPEIRAVAFVGGRANGREVAAQLVRRDQRFMLEMEGVNAYGLWNFSDWDRFEAHVRGGYEYGKQRCTAYARFVVQRRLFAPFLEHYRRAVSQVQVGHPLLGDGEQAPAVTYGPLIHGRHVQELHSRVREALHLGAIPLYEGELDASLHAAGTYLAPRLLLAPPRASQLYRQEPFGPVDTVVVVDSVEELITEMNVSGGSLVATLATDDLGLAQELIPQVQAFKVGVNALRSRGDREEAFGGAGASWQGCFVGGEHLVRAVTQGEPGEQPFGNFASAAARP